MGNDDLIFDNFIFLLYLFQETCDMELSGA